MSYSTQETLLENITWFGNKTSEINNFMESLILPYQYFKKLNILPINMIEEEMDKYFDIKHLLLENYFNLPYILKTQVKLYELPISNITLDNYSKFYNNFPLHLITDNCGGERPIKEDIIKNLDKFNNVLEESDYCVWTNRIFNMVETIFYTNLRKTEKFIKEYEEHNKLIEKTLEQQRAGKIPFEELVEGDIIDFEYNNRLGDGKLPVYKYKLLQKCFKTYKFIEVDIDTPKNRIVKIEKLKLKLQTNNYVVHKQ